MNVSSHSPYGRRVNNISKFILITLILLNLVPRGKNRQQRKRHAHISIKSSHFRIRTTREGL